MTAHAYGCAVKNKPKAEQETAQPTAARFNNRLMDVTHLA